MTAQWIIEDGVPWWGDKYAGAIPLDNNGDPVTDWSDPDAHAAVAALVADVRAAREVERLRDRIKRRADVLEHVAAKAALTRLVDDMAAVIRRLSDFWIPEPEKHEWRRMYGAQRQPMSPGEVAALHHARQQEQT